LRLKKVFNIVFVTGFIMGLIAAAIQSYIDIQPPEAYGICLVGQPRDFINLIINNNFSQNWPVTEVFIIYPTLLVMGVVLGSFISAQRKRELNFRPGPVRSKLSAFTFGFLVINFALLWGSCPIRTGLLVSYGNIMAVIALGSIALGAILACIYVRIRVRLG